MNQPNYHRFTLTLFILLFANVFASYSMNNLYIKKIEAGDGLLHSEVRNFLNDEQGLMWISTSGGINIYDGVALEQVVVDKTNKAHALNYREIAQDKFGNIWFGVGKDIVIYNKKTETNKLLSDLYPQYDFHHPIVRFGSRGNALVYEKNCIYIFDHNDNDYTFSRVINFGCDIYDVLPLGDQKLFVSTSQGIKLYDNGKITHFNNLIAYRMYRINEVVYACGSNGIYRINSSTDVALLSTVEDAKILLLDKTFWLATPYGLYSIDMIDGAMPAEEPMLRISDLRINNISADFNGQLWLATNEGIQIVSPNSVIFKSTHFYLGLFNNNVRTLCEDKQGNIWVGSQGDNPSLLFLPKGNTSKATYVDLPLSGRNVHYVISGNNEVYVASNQVFKVRWDGSMQKPDFDIETIIEPLSENDNIMMCRLDNNRDNLWIAYFNNGVYRYSLKDKKYEKFDINIDTKYGNPAKTRNIVFDKNDNMWIATSNGLYVVEAGQIKTPHHYIYDKENPQSLQFNYIIPIHFDKNGYVWIGTYGGGLYRSKLDEKRLPSSFEKIPNLPSEMIKSIEEDAKGNIWISTNQGICRYETRTEQINLYGEHNGVLGLEFGELASTARRNGDLIFGSKNGITIFNGDEIVKDTIAPKIYIKDFYLLNKQIEVGSLVDNRILLNEHINNTQEISLNSNENQFGFDFRAIHYLDCDMSLSKYKLEGVDSEWITLQSSHGEVRYTNVPPGYYNFKIKAANSDGKWSEERIVKLHIKKPWWSTNFALLCYAIILSFILFVMYKISGERGRQKALVVYAEKEKRRIEEMAAMQNTLFTNISHEFRTPLSLIIAPAKELKSQKNIDTRQFELVEKIDYNANILLRLITQLLDFSRFNRNKLEAKPEVRDLVAALRGAANQFREFASLSQVSLLFESNSTELPCRMDYTMLEHILYNLISNALKHTDAGGSVRLILENSAQNVTIKVVDTGRGISPEIQANIFERFVKGTQGGTGIGLNFTKNLVEMNGGNIHFTTSDNGTAFCIDFSDIVEQQMNNTKEFKTEDFSQSNTVASALETYLDDNTQSEEKPTLLIVEDNVSLMDYLKTYFSRSYDVIIAKDGEEGYNKAQAAQPDIIISDVMMPKMSGDVMCRKIKDNTATSHIPVVLLTAKASASDSAHGYQQGADIYCAKPFDIEILASAINSLLENRRKLQSIYKDTIDVNVAEIVDNRSDEELIKKAIAFVEENIQDEKLTIGQVAESVGLSYYLLNKKLKSLVGLQGGVFVRNIRLKHAAKLLVQSDLSISEIVFSTGFADIRNFRKNFSDMYGMTPTEYKKMNVK